MHKSELLRAIQQEIRRHHFDTFIDEPPSIAQGGRGIVTPGCVTCRKKLFTTPDYVNHLCNDVLPKLIEKLSARSFVEWLTEYRRNICEMKGFQPHPVSW